MISCFFVSDLHGRIERYQKLFQQIEQEKPDAVFIGGDLSPHYLNATGGFGDFTEEFIFDNLRFLRKKLENNYPQIFLILGNDDPGSEEEKFKAGSEEGLFHYSNKKKFSFQEYTVYGYSFVPPTPFLLKDWEKYDVIREVNPGCIPFSEGFWTTDTKENAEGNTIKEDLEELTGNNDLSKSIFLFHSPPYKTHLDRAGLDGIRVDNIPLDVHVGSVAIRELIEEKQPLLTLHGHIHESTRRTGKWKQRIGRTWMFNASHGGAELALVRFDAGRLKKGERVLL